MSRFPHRILCAVDGSREADLALAHVVDLMAGTDAELHLLHVALLSPWVNPSIMSSGQRERLREEGQRVADAAAERVRTSDIEPVAAHLRMGRATDEILRMRDEVAADLIVIGSRGLNAFTRVLLGSDAEGVVRHAPCPVLVVRRDQ